MTRRSSISLHRNKKLAALMVLSVAGPGLASATAGTFSVAEPVAEAKRPEAGAGSSDLSRAGILPLALAFAASEARREVAAAPGELRAGADGKVDLSLATVIDHTLRGNLELLVQSYAPALSEEQLRSRQALYDPLLTFLVSLASSQNPTASALAGAEVISNDTARWDGAITDRTPWGGTATLAWNNVRSETNSSFASLNPAYDSSLGFEITQPLLRNFGRKVTEREIYIARNERSAARIGYRDDVQTKVTEAINAYWDLTASIRNLEVQREALRISNELLKINRTRVDVGTMAPLDISIAEAEVKGNEKSVIEAEEVVRRQEDRIRQLMNVPSSSAIWVASFRPVDPPVFEARSVNIDASIETALANRGELKRQELLVANAQIRLDYAKNQTKPGLNLRAAYGPSGLGGTQIVSDDNGNVSTIPGGYGDAIDQMFGFDFYSWSVGATFDIPLFNTAARANEAASALSLAAERDRLELLKQTVSVEIRRLGRAVETNQKRIEAAQATHKLQEERLNAESKKFEHGLSTNFEVQQAQRDLIQAQVGEIVSRLDYVKAIADLERAMGTVLATHGVVVSE